MQNEKCKSDPQPLTPVILARNAIQKYLAVDRPAATVLATSLRPQTLERIERAAALGDENLGAEIRAALEEDSRRFGALPALAPGQGRPVVLRGPQTQAAGSVNPLECDVRDVSLSSTS